MLLSESESTAPFYRRPEAGLILFFLLAVPFLLWRASLVDSFWVDEIYTVTLINHTFAKALELTTFDAHPPGYYFFLKVWLKPFRMMGIEPGLVLTRMPGIIAWVLMGVGAFVGGRRLIGRQAGLVAAIALCLSANAVHMGTEARQYSIVIPTMFACWLLLMLLQFDGDSGRPGGSPRTRRLWFGYAFFGGISLWFQLLTGPMMAVLGTMWLLLAARRRDGWQSSFARQGFWAHVAIALLIAPWLGSLQHNIAHLHFMPRPWQTPATGLNFLTVFAYWIPLGQIDFGLPWGPAGVRIWYPWNVLLGVSLLTLLVPGRILVQAWLRPRAAAEDRLLFVGVCGVGATVGFTFLIWWFDRWGIARTFHGTRYPMVALGPWVLGMVALGAWGVERLAWRPRRLWGVMAPWLLCGVLGQIVYHTVMAYGNITWARDQFPRRMPEKGSTVHVMPSEFIPYVERAFTGEEHAYHLRPVEELALLPEDAEEAHVFDVSPVVPAYRDRDIVLFSLLLAGKFSDDQRSLAVPPGYPTLYYFLLRDPNRELLERMGTQKIAMLARDEIPEDHAALAVPEHQSMLRGWSVLELAGDKSIMRWGGAPRISLRFDEAVAPGRYRLHVVGYEPGKPANPATLRLQFRGEPEAHTVIQPEGSFHIVKEFTLSRRHDPPVLLIGHPVWKPRDFIPGALDPRDLSILLNYAWLEPAE